MQMHWRRKLIDASYIVAWRGHGNLSPCTVVRGKCQLYADYFMMRRPISNWDPKISDTPFSTNCGGQRANHSVMTHPSKMGWHQLNAITHWVTTASPLNQERFSGCLLLALPYRYYFVWRRRTHISSYIVSLCVRMYVCMYSACFVLYYHSCSKFQRHGSPQSSRSIHIATNIAPSPPVHGHDIRATDHYPFAHIVFSQTN